MTTPLNDYDRLVDAVAEAWYQNKSDEARRWAKMHLHALTKAGITLTPPPAPEPVYPVTFPSELYWVARSLVETSKEKTPREGELLDALSDLLANATPEER